MKRIIINTLFITLLTTINIESRYSGYEAYEHKSSARKSSKRRPSAHKGLAPYEHHETPKPTIKKTPTKPPTVTQQIQGVAAREGQKLVDHAQKEAQQALQQAIHHHVKQGVTNIIGYGYNKIGSYIDRIIKIGGGLSPYLRPKH